MRLKFSELSNYTDFQLRATQAADAHLFTLAGGTRGPGKSHWLRWWLLRDVLKLKAAGIQDPTVGLFCENYPVLKDRQVKKIKTEFPRALGVVKSTQEEGLGYHLHSGGMIALRNLDDPSKYVGAEFASIGIDEITKSSRDTFDVLRGSLRWPGVESSKFVCTGNPGGIGHLWVKELFIDGELWPELEAEYDQGDFAYVRGTPTDNPHLPAGYWKMLNTLPEELRRAWLEGDWSVFVGQVFTEWRRHLHVVKPFELPDDAQRWVAIDWGYSAPWCALWVARCKLDFGPYSPEFDRTIIYREAYQAGLTDPEQAEEINRLSAEDGWIDAYVGDPSMWTPRTVGKRAVSTYDVYKELGIRMTKGENDRITGKRRVHDALALLPDGQPSLLIFENCRNLIRTLPALPYSETRVEDVDKDAEDHAYDALRYGLSYKPPQRLPTKSAPVDYWAEVRGKKRGQVRPLDVPIEVEELEALEKTQHPARWYTPSKR